jgi:hypothetical protein
VLLVVALDSRWHLIPWRGPCLGGPYRICAAHNCRCVLLVSDPALSIVFGCLPSFPLFCSLNPPPHFPKPHPCRDVSPTTQMPLPHKLLTPNGVVRASLMELLRQHC